MPQLVIEQPSVPTMTVPLTKSETALGRNEDNDVVLVADEVSRHHAKLIRRGSHYLLQDLDSLNGTYVNRQRIRERVLSHLDEVWLGSKCLIVFHSGTEMAVGHAAEEATEDLANEPTDIVNQAPLVNDLDRIREEMDRVGNNLSMIGRRASGEYALQETIVPEDAELDVQTMARAYRRLEALHKATKTIASDFDLDKRLAEVLDTAIEVMEAERGFVLLNDEEGGGLSVRVAREMGRDLKASSPSMSIAGRAATEGEPVLMADSNADSAFGGSESIIRQRIVSAMCVPLRVEDRILGSVYLDTRQSGQPFGEEDLELFATMASQSAMAIDNVRLHERMVEAEKKRANLGRFLSPAIVEQIMKEDTALELGGRKRLVTTMFCDIRGFTPYAERTPPDTLTALLNEHFTAMTQVIFSYEGTLDKFIGDAIMAVFGSPLSKPDDAARAVCASVAIQARNDELNKARASANRPPLRLGIGMATGEVVAGYMGSPDRMEFTVVGDRVNKASRLCSHAGGGEVIVDQATYAQVKDWALAEDLGGIALKENETPEPAFKIKGVRRSR